MQRHPRWFLISSIAVLVLVATACGGGANAAGGTASTLSIVSPTDGATVAEPFDIRLQASVPLGELSTGNDHVHLCVDGQSCDTEYLLAYSDTFQFTTLTPGTHTIEASLRHADHSAAGPTATITVTVTGAAASPSPTTGGTTGAGSRY